MIFHFRLEFALLLFFSALKAPEIWLAVKLLGAVFLLSFIGYGGSGHILLGSFCRKDALLAAYTEVSYSFNVPDSLLDRYMAYPLVQPMLI